MNNKLSFGTARHKSLAWHAGPNAAVMLDVAAVHCTSTRSAVNWT